MTNGKYTNKPYTAFVNTTGNEIAEDKKDSQTFC